MFGLSKEPLTFQYIEDLVDEYGAVRSDQLLRLYENMGIPRKKAEKAINSVKNLASRIFYDKNADTYYSVSYTHLDVYKRQSQSQACANLVQALFCAHIFGYVRTEKDKKGD